MDDLVSILGVIGIFFLPIIMVILALWFKSSERRKYYQLQAELYAKAIEKGQPVPTDWFAAKPKKKHNPLNTGIILIAVGIGVSLFIWLTNDAIEGAKMSKAASLGIIPFLIGVAYLLIHFIEQKKAKNENAQ